MTEIGFESRNQRWLRGLFDDITQRFDEDYTAYEGAEGGRQDGCKNEKTIFVQVQSRILQERALEQTYAGKYEDKSGRESAHHVYNRADVRHYYGHHQGHAEPKKRHDRSNDRTVLEIVAEETEYGVSTAEQDDRISDEILDGYSDDRDCKGDARVRVSLKNVLGNFARAECSIAENSNHRVSEKAYRYADDRADGEFYYVPVLHAGVGRYGGHVAL